jgi:hypothetical protein
MFGHWMWSSKALILPLLVLHFRLQAFEAPTDGAHRCKTRPQSPRHAYTVLNLEYPANLYMRLKIHDIQKEARQPVEPTGCVN